MLVLDPPPQDGIIPIAGIATSRTQSRKPGTFFRTGIRTTARRPAPVKPIQLNGAAFATAVFAVVATLTVAVAVPNAAKSMV